MNGIPTDPQRAIFTMRMIWAALTLGQAIFFGIALMNRGVMGGGAQLAMMPYIALGMAVAVIPVGFSLRRMHIEKGKREGNPIQGLATGTILFLACCEGPSFFGSVCIMLTGDLVAAWVPAVATALMLIAFPRPEQLL